MGKNMRFCFRVDKKAGLSEDDFGNPTDAFISAKVKSVKSYNLSEEDYKSFQDSIIDSIAEELGCEEEFLIPITINEYLDETETDI